MKSALQSLTSLLLNGALAYSPTTSVEMAEPFDPYYKWLGIPPQEQPPNYYRLLGINLFESDSDVISAAADRQMTYIRTYQTGTHSDASQQILSELARARRCLLDVVARMAYNYELRGRLSTQSKARQPKDAFSQSLRGAASYVTAEIKRLWLSFVQLPAAYLALGRDIVLEGRFREGLPGQYDRLDRIIQRYQSRGPSVDDDWNNANSQKSSRAWPLQRLIAITQIVRNWLGTAVYLYRRRAVLRGIGRAAYSIHLGESGPQPLAGRIEMLKSRLTELQGCLDKLSEVRDGQFLSPQRTAWLLGSIFLLPILLLLWLY